MSLLNALAPVAGRFARVLPVDAETGGGADMMKTIVLC